MLNVLIGAAAGAVVGTVVYAVTAKATGKPLTWSGAAAAAVGGAVFGGVAGATMGTSLLVSPAATQAASWAAAGAASGFGEQITLNTLEGRRWHENLLESTALGAGTGLALYGAGRLAAKPLSNALERIVRSDNRILKKLVNSEFSRFFLKRGSNLDVKISPQRETAVLKLLSEAPSTPEARLVAGAVESGRIKVHWRYPQDMPVRADGYTMGKDVYVSLVMDDLSTADMLLHEGIHALKHNGLTFRVASEVESYVAQRDFLRAKGISATFTRLSEKEIKRRVVDLYGHIGLNRLKKLFDPLLLAGISVYTAMQADEKNKHERLRAEHGEGIAPEVDRFLKGLESSGPGDSQSLEALDRVAQAFSGYRDALRKPVTDAGGRFEEELSRVRSKWDNMSPDERTRQLERVFLDYSREKAEAVQEVYMADGGPYPGPEVANPIEEFSRFDNTIGRLSGNLFGVYDQEIGLYEVALQHVNSGLLESELEARIAGLRAQRAEEEGLFSEVFGDAFPVSDVSAPLEARRANGSSDGFIEHLDGIENGMSE